MKTKMVKIQTALLLMAGSVLVIVGTFILASPVDFYASNNIELGANVSLLNELKAPAGFLLSAGLFMISSIFVHSFADSALGLAALIYSSYAISRFISMGLDGVPAAGLIQAATLEIIIGAACLAMLVVRRSMMWRIA